MILMTQKVVSLMRRPLAVFVLIAMAIVGTAMTVGASTTTSVTWTSKEDFENNAATIGTPTARVDIDTTTSPGDVRIGATKDFVTTATITCVTSLNKIYTAGVDRTSIAVIDSTTKALIGTIPFRAGPPVSSTTPQAKSCTWGSTTTMKSR